MSPVWQDRFSGIHTSLGPARKVLFCYGRTKRRSSFKNMNGGVRGCRIGKNGRPVATLDKLQPAPSPNAIPRRIMDIFMPDWLINLHQTDTGPFLAGAPWRMVQPLPRPLLFGLFDPSFPDLLLLEPLPGLVPSPRPDRFPCGSGSGC